MIAESRTRRAGRALTAQPVAKPARRRLGRVAALGAAAALIVAGCSAGQKAQTAVQHPTVGGASADIGDIKLRNVQLSAPDATDKRWAKGSNVPVEMSIINTGHEDDTLVSVTSNDAASVVIFSDAASYQAFAGTTPSSASGTGTASPSGATPSGTGTASPSGSPAATTTVSGAPATGAAPASSQVTIPTGGSVRFGGSDGPVVLLVGLKDVVGGGQSVTLSFTFAAAGSTTVITPVDLTVGGYSNAPTVSVHGEAAEH